MNSLVNVNILQGYEGEIAKLHVVRTAIDDGECLPLKLESESLGVDFGSLHCIECGNFPYDGLSMCNSCGKRIGGVR